MKEYAMLGDDRTYQDIILRNWNTLVKESGSQRKDPAPTKWLGLIRAAYSEPQRYYHTQRHLAEVLELFEINRRYVKDEAAVLAAIFFHDIVYRTEAGLAPAHNEKKSAQIAGMALDEMGFSQAFTRRVQEMIAATATHEADVSKDVDTALFLDMDMAILGAKPDRYREYSKQVRWEYVVYDDATFAQGRLQLFVLPTLEKGVFLTPVFKDRYEAQALVNIQNERQELQRVLANVRPSVVHGKPPRP